LKKHENASIYEDGEMEDCRNVEMEIFLIHLQWKFRDEEIGLKNEL
jgi:hypothetical protein